MGAFSSSRGNKYILVAVDYLSKWVEVKALPTNDARVVCKFLKSLFARFGSPRAIISDRGKLKTRWSGPFTITKVFSYGTVELSQANGPNFKLNGHRVKHYFGGDVPQLDYPDCEVSQFVIHKKFHILSFILGIQFIKSYQKMNHGKFIHRTNEALAASQELAMKAAKPTLVVIARAQTNGRPWLGHDSLLLEILKSIVYGGLMEVIAVGNKMLQGIPIASYDDPTASALFHCVSQVEARLVEFKEHEVKFCERIRGLERDVKIRDNKIEYLKNELEQVKKEKESLDNKSTGFENALKDSSPPLPIQIYSPPKKDLSWTGFPKFVDDTVTDYSRPTPSIDASKCNKSKLQSSKFSVSKHGESSGSIMLKPMIKFVKEADCPRVTKTNNTENARKSTVKYAEMYRNISKDPKVRGNQRNWNNLKSQQLGKDFLMQNKACFKCGYFDHLASNCGVWVDKGKTWPKDNYAHKSMTPRAILLKHGTTPIVGNLQNNIDDKRYWDSGCSLHMTRNISYLSEYEPYDGGYVSFGHGGGKITDSDYGGATQDRKSTNGGEAFPTVSSLDAGQDRENIAKTSAFPHDSSPRVTSLDADEGNMQQRIHELMELCTSLQRQQSQMAAKIKDQDLEISRLKAIVKSLEDKEIRSAEPTQEDALITGGIMEIWEELGADKSTELGRNDTEEMVNVLSLMEATNILTSGGAAASVSPTNVLPAAGVPTVSGSFSTSMRSQIIRAKDKDKEKMIEPEVPKKRKIQEQIDAQVAREMEEEFTRENQRLSEQLARDSKIARLHAEKELKIMIEGLDRSNKVIAKHLREYKQAEADLSVGEKLEMISELVKYQDHRDKILKYQAQQSKPLSKKEQREFYMSLEDFVPVSSKEESKRVKIQGLKIDQGSSKRVKTSKSVSKGVSEEELKGMMDLVPLEEVYIEALQQLDIEDLHQLWTLVKETFNIKHATSDKEKELWVELKRPFEPDFEDQLWTHNQAFMHDPLDWELYDTCGVHHVSTKDQEIFMLVEKDYPLRKGLATVMISNKLQVEQYSKMANDLILKIHNIVNSPR
nr:reverse transcriptase domain-containing protein [Tanacetum cinerariifolium]